MHPPTPADPFADLRLPMPRPRGAEWLPLARQIQTWAADHLDALDQAPLGAEAPPEIMRALLLEPAPESGRPFEEVFARFREQVLRYSYPSDHPRFLAFIPGAPSVPSMLGEWLASSVNLFCGVWREGAGPTQVELTVLRWFADLLEYPATSRGILTGGGSEANLTALVTAREAVPPRDWPRLRLYTSEQRHRSIDRAAKIMGLQASQIRPIPDGHDQRLDPHALRQQVHHDRREGLRPWLVAANAGATNTGFIDPLEAIAEVAARESLWFHVDAAYGWPVALLPEGREWLRGIGRADSITLDPHKWFAQSFEAGGLLVRDGALLERAFRLEADYMQDVTPQEGEVNLCDHGLALTRRFRALKIWFSVQMLGLNWFRELIDRNQRMARYAAGRIRALPGLELLAEPQLSIVCFAIRDTEEVNRRRLERLREAGVAFLSSTRLRGRFAIRLCFVNGRTTSGDVDLILSRLTQPDQ